jgi:hypothetical protein
MTGWLAESNRALRRRLDRRFKRRKRPPPDTWVEVAKSLAELAPDQGASASGE